MRITDVRIRKVTGGGKLKAFVSITFDDIFVVHDLKIIEGDKGVFVAMPSRKTPSGEFRDTAHPIKTEGRRMIQKAVLAKYQEMYPGELSTDLKDHKPVENSGVNTEASPPPGDTIAEPPASIPESGNDSPFESASDTKSDMNSGPAKDENDTEFSPF